VCATVRAKAQLPEVVRAAQVDTGRSYASAVAGLLRLAALHSCASSLRVPP